MATPSDLAQAPSTVIRRVAACVNRLEDRGETLTTIRRRIAEQTAADRWPALLTCDASLTAAELTEMAHSLGTTTTWLLTGRQPMPTINARRKAHHHE